MNFPINIPPPKSVGQSTEGSPGVNEISRRRFLQRSGMVAVATFATWNSTAGRAFGTEEGEGSLLLVCQDEPANASFDNAWPDSLADATRQTVATPLDEHGHGTIYKLIHWVELHSWPKRKQAVSVPGGEHVGQVTAHMAIVKEYWTWKKRFTGNEDMPWEWVTDAWVSSTMAHITAGGSGSGHEKFKATTSGEGENAEIVFNDAQDHSNKQGPTAIYHGSELLGWIMVSYSVDDFKLRSDAVFVPKSYVSGTSFGYGGNISFEYGGVSAGGDFNWTTEVGVNQPPNHSPILLDWTFVIRRNTDGVEESANWQPPSPGVVLP
jgi:hypothetical protein